jgi:hypothetical protein
MTTKIACSACHSVFAAGATSCPNCGLQLVAYALPVAPKKAWWKTGSGIVIILSVLALLVAIALMK